MLPFVGDLDVAHVHVQAPTDVVFLCGGPCTDLSQPTPVSLRDAFLKIVENKALVNRNLVQAEDISRLALFTDCYSDLLAFETEFAQITELILLFCESEGSLAELGAFAMVPDIASRLMVVMRDKYWEADSFVKLGPLRFLEKQYGSRSVFVLNDSDLALRGSTPTESTIPILKALLEPPIAERLKNTREPTTFVSSRPGHLIKLAVGLIQEYGALTTKELVDAFAAFSITKTETELSGYLLCAKSVGWITEQRRGHTNYFVAKDNLPDAATLRAKEDAKIKNKARRRLMIRDHWKQADPPLLQLGRAPEIRRQEPVLGRRSAESCVASGASTLSGRNQGSAHGGTRERLNVRHHR